MTVPKHHFPEMGERALIVGQTGSGKTAFACHLLHSLKFAPFIIYDTKEEEKFDALERSTVVHNEEEKRKALSDEEIDFVIYRPDLDVTVDSEAMDNLLLTHYNEHHNIGAYLDEAYSFHNGGRAGTGLTGLLTRGRSRGITSIISTQRPALISRFCISEAQKHFIFRLTDMKDKKRIGDFVPDFAELSDPPRFGYWRYSVGDDAPQKFDAVPLVMVKETAYSPAPLPAAQSADDDKPKRKWI